MTPIIHTHLASASPGAFDRPVRHPLKQAVWVLLAALLSMCVLAPQAHAAFGYRMPIAINLSKVSGTVSNFPVLVSITSANLRTEINGGHVKNGSGYDIVFRASDGTTALPHELESYTAINGTVIAWVKIPSLSYHSSNTQTIYVYYGDASISSPTATPASVWDSNFKAVYHLASNENDSTSNNNHGTNYSSTNTTGKIADGQAFSGSNQYIKIASSSSLLIDTNLTVSAWVKPSSFSGWPQVVAKAADPRPSFKVQFDSSGKVNFTTPYNYPAAGTLSTGTWYHVTCVAAGSSRKIFVNGSQVNTDANDGGGAGSGVTARGHRR